MFDFSSLTNMRETVQQHDKEWVVLSTVTNDERGRWVLVVEEYSTLPADVKLILIPKKSENQVTL